VKTTAMAQLSPSNLSHFEINTYTNRTYLNGQITEVTTEDKGKMW